VGKWLEEEPGMRKQLLLPPSSLGLGLWLCHSVAFFGAGLCFNFCTFSLNSFLIIFENLESSIHSIA
jgi:hypothetical protein